MKLYEILNEQQVAGTVKNKFLIPDYRMHEVQKLISKLNAKTEASGGEPFQMKILNKTYVPHPMTYKDADGKYAKHAADVVVYEIEIEGRGPKLAGWTFLGTLDHHSIPGAVSVHAVPGETVPPKFFTSQPVCDHCGKIRYRVETFVLRHENGEEKQVGRNCLRAFLGVDPSKVFRALQTMYNFMKKLEDEELATEEEQRERLPRNWRQDATFNVHSILSIASSFIRQDGYVSRQNAEQHGKRSTTDQVLDYLWAGRSHNEYDVDDFIYRYTPTSHDEQVATDTIAWIKQQPASNEYMHNLKNIADKERVGFKLLGYAVSAVQAYLRATQTQKPTGPRRVSAHVGQVGEKIQATVTVLGITPTYSNFGRVLVHRFLDDQGRSLVWFANTDPKMEQGQQYNISGTVKQHGEFKGQKQTVLTRVKVI